MINKRKLINYRKAALIIKHHDITTFSYNTKELFETITKLSDQILELTQELIDQHLLQEKIENKKITINYDTVFKQTNKEI